MKPRRILLAAAIVFVLFGYPGFLRGFDELFESRTGDITDWGSPVFTEIWHVLDILFAGTAPMFVLQGGLLLAGSYALLRRVVPDRSAAWGTMLVLLAPPVIAATTYVGEDALLAGLLVTGFALALKEARWRRIAGVAALLLASTMREGAIVAVLPLVVAVPWATGRGRRLGVALAVWGTILVLGFGLDRLVVDRRTQRREVRLAMVDLIGTIANAGLDDAALAELHLPFAVTTQIGARAKQAYAKREIDHGDHRLFEPAADDTQGAVIAARRTLSRAHPAAYFSHRVHELAVLLGLRRDPHTRPVFFSEFAPSKKIGFAYSQMAHHSLAQKLLLWPVKLLSKTRLFRPYLFFFLAIVLLGIAVVRKHGLAGVILASGLGYELVLGITTSDPGYTDSTWLMVATTLAAFAIARCELEARNERIGEQAPVGVADDDRAQHR
ncbi:MAG: hypothetical protein ABJE66_05100 [Deltaproteobacteria bacterium]